jgi:hypothetical protein
MQYALSIVLLVLHCATLFSSDDWRKEKIAAYEKMKGKTDKHGNRVGRSHDLGGDSRVSGKATLLNLIAHEEPPVNSNSLLVSALRRRIEVQFISELPQDVSNFEKMIEDSTQLWVWAGRDEGCLPPAHLDVIRNKMKKGMGVFLLADNTPFTHGVEEILQTVSPDADVEGDYLGEQIILSSTSGPGFDGGHPLFHGISKLYEGNTVSTITGKKLKTIARSTDGNPLICAAQSPPGYGKVLVTGGFTALMDQFWDTAGTERLALNAVAYLAGVER